MTPEALDLLIGAGIPAVGGFLATLHGFGYFQRSNINRYSYDNGSLFLRIAGPLAMFYGLWNFYSAVFRYNP